MDVIGSSEIAAGVEPAHRNGKAATLTEGLAHDESILLGVGRHLGSQSRAKTSMTIMRAPQSGHEQGSTRGASGVTSGCFCGSTAGEHGARKSFPRPERPRGAKRTCWLAQRTLAPFAWRRSHNVG
jgi:hypothetical protein